MVKGICVSFISLLLLAGLRAEAQDTIMVPLHIRAGFDVASPVNSFINKNLASYGVLGSFDLDESLSAIAGARYTSFSATEYNYDFSSRGLSFVFGAGYNFIKPKTAQGKYYAGLEIKYGISFYGQEASRIEYSNSWGSGETSLPLSHHVGNYLELGPGVRTELFSGVTIGWNLYMRVLLGAGTGSNLKPVYMPGYGDATSTITTGASYYISISIPYKKVRVIIKPKPVETEEETKEEGETSTSTSTIGPR